jgi:hypothetical protein
MTPTDIEDGRRICEVGIAAFLPAEFVIVRIPAKIPPPDRLLDARMRSLERRYCVSGWPPPLFADRPKGLAAQFAPRLITSERFDDVHRQKCRRR